jgi:uncharacterized protein (DUF4415 family)
MPKRKPRGPWVKAEPESAKGFFESDQTAVNAARTKPGRPKSANAKKSVHLRLSPDVLAWFRASGPGWQTRIDETLRKTAKLGRRK